MANGRLVAYSVMAGLLLGSAGVVASMQNNAASAKPDQTACELKEAETIKDIARVFMNRATEYTFVVKVGEHAYGLRQTSTTYGPNDVQFIDDVPSDEPMWAKLSERSMSCNNGPGDVGYRKKLEVHVHTVANVEGGGWNAGKGGSGITVPIK